MAKIQRKPVAGVAGAQKELEEKAKADSKAIQQKIDENEQVTGTIGDPRDAGLGGPEGKEEKAAQLLASQAPPALADQRGRRRVVLADLVDVEPLQRGFNLTADDGTVTTYEAGTSKMPRAHANHWYAAANGVVLK